MWLDHATPGRMPERVGESVLLARLIAVGNLLMRALLRSRLHRLVDKDLMILTVTGRKTGTQYRIPLSYIRDGDVIILFRRQDSDEGELGQEPSRRCAGNDVGAGETPRRVR